MISSNNNVFENDSKTEIPSSASMKSAISVEILESGFSLSEQAHESSSSSSSSDNNAEAATLKNSRAANDTATFSVESSISELRQRVVDDVVGGGGGCVDGDGERNDTTLNSGSNKGVVVTSPLEFSPGISAKLPLVYCDFTASHRPLQSIESYLTQECLPFYGNTHTNTSLTGSQSTAFCSEARQIVGEVCGAKTTGKASQDVVLFSGNGTTSAVELLIDCLGLKHHINHFTATATNNNINNSNNNDDNYVPTTKPVIFVGPYEHHSNLLPWRELGYVDIEMVRLDGSSNVDGNHLQSLLVQYQHRQVKIGAFSAASNVTGMVANDLAITALLHQHGALSIWDYATAASYVNVQMNPTHPNYHHELIAKDAILMSGHKLLGGVGTPGVLLIKKHLVSQQNPPTKSGGGTVFYVTADHHRFLSNRIERFEGGTPNIVGIWRLGLALTAKQQLKQQFQQLMIKSNATAMPSAQLSNTSLDYDIHRAERIQNALCNIPNLVLMDGDYYNKEMEANTKKNKLPIFSFLIKCGTRFLHYNYVCAVLNDLFGIQSRGGCQCAGPFAQYLLGLNGSINTAVEECLVHTKDELLRPGFTRLSLPTFGTTDAIEDYVLHAISWVAEHGWKLMHVYRCNHRTGDWRHKSRPGAPLGKLERKWLSHYHHNNNKTAPMTTNTDGIPTLEEAKATADRLLDLVVKDHSSLVQAIKMSHETDEDSSTLSSLRWYVYPKEVAMYLQQGLDHVPETLNRNALVGAIRPVAWFPSVIEESSKETTTTTTTTSPVVVGTTATATTRNISPPTTTSSLRFQDGEHFGTATLEEIQEGFNDGELTEACSIFESDKDSWTPIVDFLRDLTSSNPSNAALPSWTPTSTQEVPTLSVNPAPTADTRPSPSTPSLMVSFRDGDHSGKATWEEIEAGYDDGELSAGCHIYDPTTDEWETIDMALSRYRTAATALNNAAFPPQQQAEPLLPSKSDVPVNEKHEKKKPQRDSAAWGQGSMVQLRPSIPSSTAAATSNGNPNETKPSKKNRHKHTKPPAKMMRLVTQAIIQWDMLQEGDRLLLGLSGGKDSLSLLHVLMEFKKKLPIHFDIEVCTIDPMTPSFDPSPLIPYVESLGLKYHYIRDEIIERANNAGKDGKIVSSLCSYCARMKRGNLYTTARKNNCNKLVLAQHLDDLAESFMMSVMHNGFLRTMKANYKINAGDLSVIRPLAYCRESLMTDFAQSSNLPIINENCPACFEEPKERARIKKLLAKEESLYPSFYDNIRRSLMPLMHDDATAILRSYTEEALAKSRKDTPQNSNNDNNNDITTTTSSSSSSREDRPSSSIFASSPRVTKEFRTNGDSKEIDKGNEYDNDEEEKKEAMSDISPLTTTAKLADYSDEALVRELARRRAEKYRLAGAMKVVGNDEDDYDPTGQVCTLNGGNDSIPCRELME